jgi:hypothetical protein
MGSRLRDFASCALCDNPAPYEGPSLARRFGEKTGARFASKNDGRALIVPGHNRGWRVGREPQRLALLTQGSQTRETCNSVNLMSTCAPIKKAVGAARDGTLFMSITFF